MDNVAQPEFSKGDLVRVRMTGRLGRVTTDVLISGNPDQHVWIEWILSDSEKNSIGKVRYATAGECPVRALEKWSPANHLLKQI